MNQLFTASDYARISNLVFQDNYPGYKPNVVESPNGDGVKDTKKQYAHIAEKYLFQESENILEFIKTHGYHPHHERGSVLSSYLNKAHDLAMQIAITIGVPKPFWPVKKYGALRVLEYDGEATTAPHTDFDLFTLMCYRNDESCFKYLKIKNPYEDPVDPNYSNFRSDNERRWNKIFANSALSMREAQKLNAQVHFGELLQAIDPKQWLATPHEVVASGGPWQYSCVYFAVPDEDVVLPSGQTVGQWMIERKNRSRYARE